MRSAEESVDGGLPKAPKRWGAALALGALFLFAAWMLLPVEEWLKTTRTWFAEQGLLGSVLFVLLYTIAVILLMPGSALSISAGLLYGFWGLPLAVAGATMGASIAFLLARHVAHEKVDFWLQDRPRVEAVAAAVNEGGWKVVGLVRLSPVIPFNLQNYFFGLTGIPFWHYVMATFVGIIPGTAVNIYLGTIGNMALDEADGSQVRWGFFALGLIVTIIVTWFVTRKAKENLAQSGVTISGGLQEEERGASDKR